MLIEQRSAILTLKPPHSRAADQGRRVRPVQRNHQLARLWEDGWSSRCDHCRQHGWAHQRSNINGLSVQSEFNKARYGINVAGTDSKTGALTAASANSVSGTIIADLSGAVRPLKICPFLSVVDGAMLGGAWTDYTPAVTTGKGAFTTTSATGSYRVVGKTVSIRATLTITNAGTADRCEILTAARVEI